MMWLELSFQSVFFILVVFALVIMTYFEYCYSFWKNRNVPTLPATIPFGHFKEFITCRMSIGENLIDLYEKLKTYGKPYAGVYMFIKPILLILDPELAKTVLTKDFNSFTDRSLVTVDEETNPLSANILNLGGNKWKALRSKLTPAFSSGQMKMMFPTLADCGKQLEEILDQYAQNRTPFEVLDVMARFTTDIIGSAAFGFDCNSLQDPNSLFRKHGDKVGKMSSFEMLKRVLSYCFPTVVKKLKMKLVPTDTNDFFLNLVKDTVDYRVKNEVIRKDFLETLMHLQSNELVENMQDGEDLKMTIEQIAAQCFMFFLAGFETSSSTLSSIIFHLTTHQDIQDKVRTEINEVIKKHRNQITYDTIQEMIYTQKVIDEVLRLNPPVSFLTRECVQDYKIPNSTFILPSGTAVMIPARAIQNDPDIFPNPELFDPERFSAEEKNKRHPYTYMPFGFGPRQCIGFRFAIMQIKVGLATLLKNHKFTLNSQTKIPVKEHPTTSTYGRVGGIWVNAVRIT